MWRKRLAGLAAASGLLLVGVGVQPALADEGGTAHAAAVSPSVTVNGAGSTFISNIVDQWRADIKKSQNISVNYTGVGSGAGRSQFIANTVDFAGTDVPLTADETKQAQASRGNFTQIVITAGGIALMFNVQGVTSLKLSPATIAKIFIGKITNWNDPAITADNGTALPNKPIQVFVRSDKSGTSQVFTEFLTATGGSDWPAGATGTFPTNNGQIGKSGSDGVSNAVQATDGGVGYAEVSFAKERTLNMISVKNGGGQFLQPTTAAVTSAIDDATLNADGTVTLAYATSNPASYPISTISYIAASTTMSADLGSNLKAFLNYALSADGQGKAPALNYAPLPARLNANSLALVAKINPDPTQPSTTTTVAPGRVGGPVAAPATTATTAKASTAAVAASSAKAPTAAPASTTSHASASATSSGTSTNASAAPTATDPVARTGANTPLIVAFGALLLALGEVLRRRAKKAAAARG